MQTVPPAYSSQIYTSFQKNSVSPDSTEKPFTRNNSSSTTPSNNSSSDIISLSENGKKLSQTNETQIDEKTGTESKKNSPQHQQHLSQEDLKTLTKLKQRDAEVRTHEQAHLSAAGQYAAGGASFSFTTGPDGKRYANSGSVPIDISKEKTPEATIQKMRTVRRAALAPASPSGADRNIAAQASAKEAQAMKEIMAEKESSVVNNSMSEVISDSDVKNNQSIENTTETHAAPMSTEPPTSDFTRKTMAAAYSAMAALATGYSS